MATLSGTPVNDYGAHFYGPSLCGESQMMGQLVADVLASTAGAVPAQQDPCIDARSAPAAQDDTLAAMYLRMWFLATGRRLQPGVRPEHLTEDELVDFWAEDLYRASGGRHAARRTHAVRDSL